MPYVYTPRKRSIGTIGTSRPTAAPRQSGGGMTGLIGTAGTSAGAGVPTSRERGAPERFEVDVMGAVQTAAMAPSHALERPLAVANTAARFLTGTPQDQKGPLDAVLQGIGDLGFGEVNVGNLVGGIGTGVNAISNVPMALMNSQDAAILGRIAALGLKDSDAVNAQTVGLPVQKRINGAPILGMFGVGGRDMTVAEFKAELATRGFNQQVNEETGEVVELPWEEVARRAQENSFAFGDKMINDSAMVDLAARMVLDPFNLLLGAGAIGKAGKLVSWATNPMVRRGSAITAAAGSRLAGAWGVGYATDMARAGIRLAQKPSALVASRAIAAGRMEGATLRGLGHVLAAPRTLLLPGTGTLARRYARGALRLDLGLLGAEVGSNLVDSGATSVLGEDNVISGFMEPIHDAAQAFLADKPMSQDIAFMMASAFAMPAVPLLREDLAGVRGAARRSFGDQDTFLWAREFGTDNSGLSARQDPLGRRRGKAREAQFIENLGGQQEFARLIDHIDMRIAFDRLKAYSPMIRHFESFDEAMARSRAIGHTLATEATRLRESGAISPELRMESFKSWGRAHARTLVDRKGNLLKDVPQRVDFELSNEALLEQWKVYRRANAELAARFRPVGEAILGRANRLTKEDLRFVRAAIASTAKGGRVSMSYVRDLLAQTPAMFEDAMLTPDQREFWTRLMNLGVGSVENGQDTGRTSRSGRAASIAVDELDAQLNALLKNAPDARELYHEAAASERKAPADPSRTTGGIVRNGRLRKIYSTKELRRLRTDSNGEIRSLTKEIDAGKRAMEQKWTTKGKLRLRRPKPVVATKPAAAPMAPIDDLRRIARTYNETAGVGAPREGEYWPLDTDFARRTALAYEDMPVVGTDAATRVAYEAFEAETLAQYRALTEAGYTFEPWTDELAQARGSEQPYATSEEMQADVRANKHLYFFTGGEPHPFLGKPLPEFGGLTANDIFRGVHDVITHATEGYQFGARGEVNAAIKHAQMYSPVARRAMLSETHGQNSWVNHGPHDPQKLAAPDRPYAEQKSALLPDQIIEEFESRYLGETHAVASRKARQAIEALDLDPETANAVTAILEARARAWASNNPGKTTADYLKRIDFEAGGDPAIDALYQRYSNGLAGYRARTAQSAFPAERAPREGSQFARRLATAARRSARAQEGILPRPGSAAARRLAEALLPETDETTWLKNTARAEILSAEGAGPYVDELREMQDIFYRAVYNEQRSQLRRNGGVLEDDTTVLFQVDSPLDTEGAAQAPVGAVLTGGRNRTTLEPLLTEPAPQALAEAGLADESPLEWTKLENGEDFAIPGGTDGEFTLMDAWRLKQQHVDPNQIPTVERVDLYDKLFRSQQRALDNVADNFNRAALAMLSPNVKLLDNEALLASIRVTDGVDGLRRLAEMTPEQFDAQMGGTGASPGFPSNHRAVQELARRMADHPDWYVLHDGETTVQFAERMVSTVPGVGLKVGNFLAMLGDPSGHPIATIDSQMVKRLTTGDLKGFLPERLSGTKGSSFKAKPIPLRLKDGSINPEVPAHLHDIPEDLLPANKKVTVFNGDYMVFNDALERAVAAKYGELPFGNGGAQWMEWDLQRGVIEPHTTVWPGSDLLPLMDPADIGAARNVARDAGGYFRQTGRREPFGSDGVFFQDGPDNAKGATEFLADGTAVIRGLNSPDISTFIHEVGHVFRRDLTPEDLAVAESHYKVADGAWTREAEEAFAGDFERWTRTGAKGAPAQLATVFAKLHEWMRQVYRTVLKRDVNPEIGQVFRNLFAEKEVLQLQTNGFRVNGAEKIARARTATGEPGTVQIFDDEMVGNTRETFLVKYADDGNAAAWLEVVFDPNTGTAAPDGLSVYTNPDYRGQGHASDLYAYAEAQGWDVEQASARSQHTLTDQGKAFQSARWLKQRAADAAELEAKRVRARELRSEVREINKRASELLTTRIDPSFLDENGNPTVSPESLDSLREQTAFVQDNFPANYGIEKAPKVSFARYEPDDSHLAALLTERSNMAQVLFDYGPIAKMTQFVGWLTSPVKASRMAHDGRQQVYNLLLPLKAKTDDVTDFLNALRDEQNKGYSTGKLNQPFFRGTTGLPPNRIAAIARETIGQNKAFVEAFERKYGGLDRMHVMLDEAHNSLVRRVDQAVMRGQKTGKLERLFRSGYWAWQHVPGLRTASDITRMASKVYYPMFRFQMDLRWQALNVIEADTIAFFRDGIDGTRFSRRRDQVVRRGGRDINLTQNAIDFHGEASGMPMGGEPGMRWNEAAYEDTGVFLTNQNLAPVLKRSFQKQSLENVDAVLNDMAASDPVLQLLPRKYGPEKGTWAQQLNETIYSFDRLGVRKSIDESVRRVRKYDKWSQAEYDQMVPFINKLIERNQQTFDDLTQVHVGNIDRSRLERTMNSFWLYWPLSYQIKATKWMVGVLTERSFGQNTNLGGAFTLNRAAERVRELSRNPEFQRQMEDNEDWWFVASMLLPIAPWDYGISLNRFVRYAGGNVLGLWPEYAGLDNPGAYLSKALEMGPVYTMDLIDRLLSQQPSSNEGPTPTSFAP